MARKTKDEDTEENVFRRRIFLSMIVPLILITLMWLVRITEALFQISFTDFGIYPLAIQGLKGILFSPFIHADFGHLFNNTVPLFFLATALFYFYSDVAFRVFLLTWIITGLLVWFAGRAAWHIGASGLIYGLASFLFFSGILRKHFRLIALSLLIVFLYGSMVWGIFPGVHKNVSWESHMLGFLSGVALSIIYRREGPQQPVYEWQEDEEQDNGDPGGQEFQEK